MLTPLSLIVCLGAFCLASAIIICILYDIVTEAKFNSAYYTETKGNLTITYLKLPGDYK